jgi:predicted DNA-binding protein with PD1-like motif
MHSKLVSGPNETRVWIAVLERGEDVKTVLLALAGQERIENASFMALGAFEKAVIAYFDWEKKKYLNIPIDEQVEVITLAGDIVPDDKGKVSLHAHVVLGRRDGTTRGGHLVEGIVRPTLEVTVTELPAHLRRHKHPELGVALIEPV